MAFMPAYVASGLQTVFRELTLNSGAETTVLIIGGGIGGLAAAVALRRVGLRAQVFERAPELREVGAGLSLWSNAVKALRRLGLEDAVVAHGSTIERAVTLTTSGQTLSETSIGALSRRAGCPTVCVHRADLQKALTAGLTAGQLHLDKTCVGFEQDTNGVTAYFADGQSQRGTLLIGADGLRSAVRQQLLGPAEPRYAGYFAFRGVAEVEHPALLPGVALFGVGSGTQIGLVACGPRRIYWFATVNAPAGSAPPPGGMKEEARARFRDWFAPVAAVIEATHEEALLRNDIVDRPPAWPWGQGRVTLLGDASHPTTPNLGQGACQALEDAVVLAWSLRQQGLQAASLRAYEAARRQRTAMVATQSWSMGKMLQWQNPLAVWLRTWLMHSRLGQGRVVRLLENLLGYEVPELESTEEAGHSSG
jgi:2-polyprenyl-6-methoxyphenol hydroxylase-like FAD-dependent oxidoreductase